MSIKSDHAFREWRANTVKSNSNTSEFTQAANTWHNISRKFHYQYLAEWFGRPIIQDPQDIIAVQELIYKVSPTLVIETGIARGGSLSLTASLLAALSYSDIINGNNIRQKRRLIGIDIDIRKENMDALNIHPLKQMMTLIQASSIDKQTFKKVKSHIDTNDKILVILDSNHSREHVKQELEFYSDLVSLNSYIVVQDTGLEDADQDTFDTEREWGPGNGPKTAVENFLNTPQGQNYIQEFDLPNKYQITSMRDGILRRLEK